MEIHNPIYVYRLLESKFVIMDLHNYNYGDP